MQKDFDEWNKRKKNIHLKIINEHLFVKVGEVWMMNLGVNIGYEQDGVGINFSRPGLIIKKFNRNMFWIVPLSTKQKSFDFYYNFVDPSDRKVSVILAQIKLCSVKRLSRKLYEIDDKNLKYIITKLKEFL
ncbi:MAG: hypothetical protein RLZZ517_320 [Candidatus Parcubacteria bacterium]|jgi:mRNA interferase MazF